jgi:hypothetical protein
MARIRPIDDGGASVHPLPTPYGQGGFSPQAFGGAAADVVDQGAQLLAGITHKAKGDADASQVMAAIAQGKKALNDVILDPEKGYASTLGDDAIKKRDDFLGKFDKAMGDAAGTLQNDDQRRAFAAHAMTIKEQGYTHAYSHEAVQQSDLAKAKFLGAVDQTIQTARQVVGDPDSLQHQVDDLHTLAEAEGLRRFGQNANAVQSVVGPIMQKGALEVMEFAIQTQDPKVAAAALEKVGQFMGNHEHVYGNAVRSMQAKAQIDSQARTVLAGSTMPVAIPGGGIVPRIDPVKLAVAIAALPADTPNLAEIQKAAEMRQKVLDDVWQKSVATVTARVHTAGQDPQTGDFNLQGATVSPADRAWLNAYAPQELTKLRGLDTREQRANSREDLAQQKDDSADNFSKVLSGMTDDATWANKYARMAPAQVLTELLDESKYPGGFTPQDRKKVLKFFRERMDKLDKLDEKPERIIKDQIAEAIKAPATRKRFEAAHFGNLFNATSAFIAQQKEAGQKVDSKAVRDFVNGKLQKIPSGSIFTSDRRQIEIDEEQAKNAGPQAAAATPVAVPKRVTAYRYSKDRTLRIPVFDDGTEGPQEPNR